MKSLLFLIFGACCFARELPYPELEWLKGNDVAATADYAEKSDETEYKRTRLTLKCLQWILDGDYLAFTGGGKTSLTPQDFEELQTRANSLMSKRFGLSEEQLKETMRAALVLGDMGKSPKARELFPECTHISDHDEFYKEALPLLMKHPERCPTFLCLHLNAKHLLLDTSHFAHYGHICHVEGGPSMFNDLAKIVTAEQQDYLEFDLFIQCCDVAGAAGHVNDNYAIVYNHDVHVAMSGVAEACRLVAKNEASQEEALMHYLCYRGDLLGLDANNPTERILIRLACMLRLMDTDQGEQLRKAAESLDPAVIEAFDPLIQREGPTPTYMPAVLGNLKRHHDLSYAVEYGLPALAKILAECPGELNFNPLAMQINQNPRCLEDSKTVEDFIAQAKR